MNTQQPIFPPKKTFSQEESHSSTNIKSHRKELFFRVFYFLIAWIFLAGVTYWYRDNALALLIKPLFEAKGDSVSIIFTDVREGFFAYLELAISLGFLCVIPIAWLQLILFFRPGLYEFEHKQLLYWSRLFCFVFLFGIILGYYWFIPIVCDFFLRFESLPINNLRDLNMVNENSIVNLRMELRLAKYIHFVLEAIFIMGCLPVIPIIFRFLVGQGVLDVNKLVSLRKYNCFFRFLVGAAVSPPDVARQCLVAIPLLSLYEIILFVCLLRQQNIKFKKKKL